MRPTQAPYSIGLGKQAAYCSRGALMFADVAEETIVDATTIEEEDDHHGPAHYGGDTVGVHGSS